MNKWDGKRGTRVQCYKLLWEFIIAVKLVIAVKHINIMQPIGCAHVEKRVFPAEVRENYAKRIHN